MYIAAMSFADIVHFSLQVADYSSTPQGTPHCPHKSPLNTVLVLSIFSQIVFTTWWVVWDVFIIAIIKRKNLLDEFKKWLICFVSYLSSYPFRRHRSHVVLDFPSVRTWVTALCTSYTLTSGHFCVGYWKRHSMHLGCRLCPIMICFRVRGRHRLGGLSWKSTPAPDPPIEKSSVEVDVERRSW